MKRPTNLKAPTNLAVSSTEEVPAEDKSWYYYPLQYMKLLRENPQYRLYLLAHCCQHIGDWYIRMASLLTLKELASDSARAISIFILVQTLTHIIFCQVGGALADSLDKRKLMIGLDVFGAVATLGFVVALREKSLALFCVFGAIRAFVQSLYDPTSRSLVPMLVSNANDLKRAATLSGLSEAFLLAIGGVLAGQTELYFGLAGCFALDSVTYALSALTLSFLNGGFKVPNKALEATRQEDISKIKEKGLMAKAILVLCYPLHAWCGMVFGAFKYLWTCGFGMVVMFKASAALCYGAADVLNVEYAGPDSRLGVIFSFLGLGSFLGPIISSFLTNAQRPSTIQLVVVGSFGIIAAAWIGMSQSSNFPLRCLFTTFRSMGGSTILVNSSLLLQEIVSPELLGRVLAVDYMLTQAAFSVSVWVVSRFIDNNVGLNSIALGLATMSAAIFGFWSIYHMFGQGASRKEYNPQLEVRIEKYRQATNV
mmetsp:Transcript_27626/g.41809  ORF Transcript_27626/g.41809 Transcript_27626/m.41809 type:complete len:482 (-) Transcript_27626:90-1535(-)|eukprot:CAMPEP_0178894990 /NCGR_PEP_ID=MMETSP0786-20121207/326_1 /TAXON_ID=186022 /ORGANISM="Thalassionema frauenfeldii, Strain CCMP 1798" /LENGTH=481 /DNA_ID=CAMNT_0020565147 /DNA_START=41 /DNA_END=1486 /DNA_ORIENTATION=-